MSKKQQELLPKLEAANIDPVSFLATDYLNHFNELLMMLEMLPDMPDMFEELEGWSPKSYKDHFRASGFAFKDLAVEAYENAPKEFRYQFDTMVGNLDQQILSTLSGLRAVGILERGLSVAACDLLRLRIKAMQDLLLCISSVIHGNLQDRDDVALGMSSETTVDNDLKSQYDIDEFFAKV